jgi:anaerobic selenocysteine-containing dehydrogenase
MNERDMTDRRIEADDLVELESLTDDNTRRVVSGLKARPYNLPRGSIGAYYPEVNGLIAISHCDLRCRTPSAKSIPVVARSVAR